MMSPKVIEFSLFPSRVSLLLELSCFQTHFASVASNWVQIFFERACKDHLKVRPYFLAIICSAVIVLHTVFPQIRPAGIIFLQGLQLRVLLECGYYSRAGIIIKIS